MNEGYKVKRRVANRLFKRMKLQWKKRESEQIDTYAKGKTPLQNWQRMWSILYFCVVSFLTTNVVEFVHQRCQFDTIMLKKERRCRFDTKRSRMDTNMFSNWQPYVVKSIPNGVKSTPNGIDTKWQPNDNEYCQLDNEWCQNDTDAFSNWKRMLSKWHRMLSKWHEEHSIKLTPLVVNLITNGVDTLSTTDVVILTPVSYILPGFFCQCM